MIPKPLLYTALLCITLLVLFFIFTHKQSAHQTDLFEREKPEKRDIQQYVKASGTLKAKEQLSVGSLVSGRVLEWYVDANDVVKKDTILAKLDDGIGYTGVEKARAFVAEKKAELERAEQLFNRAKKLIESQSIPQDEYDQRKSVLDLAIARLDGAQAELKINQLRFENLTIKSPDAGTVIARKIDVGQMVAAQLQATELFVIAKDLTQMEAVIDVDEADIGLVKTGQEAIFIVDAFPTKEFSARVVRCENMPRNSGTVISYSVILNVENADLHLKPGMTTNVYIKVADKKQVLSIPQRALRLSRTGIQSIAHALNYQLKELALQKNMRTHQSTVWTHQHNTIAQTIVQLGASDTEFVEILAGLDEHSAVITGLNKETKNNSVLERFGMKSPIGGK